MLSFSFKHLAFFIIPCSILFLNFSDSFIEVIFKRGRFDDYSVMITSLTLFFYSLGLFFFAASRLLISTFHSLKDTATPAKIATLTLAVNIVLSILLMRPLRVGGLALASSISSLVSFFFLLSLLQKRVGRLQGIGRELAKILLASGGMGLVSRLAWEQAAFMGLGLRLSSALVVAVLSYLSLCLVLKTETSRRITRWLLKKK
jgi:putative peptidoglycan lipid II flippase